MRFGYNTLMDITMIASFITDSPHSPMYIYQSIGTGEQNRCYYDVLTNQYWEYSINKDGSKDVRFYKDYTYDNGTWRGKDLKSTQTYNKKGELQTTTI